MPRYVVKMAEDKYLEWSTVVDAPVTYLMTRAEMKAYLSRTYGTTGNPEERLKRADENGTSAVPARSMKSMVGFNRAGEKERKLTIPEIIAEYTQPNTSKEEQIRQ